MTFLLRVALALTILAWAPLLLEEFESPKAALVRVVGGAMLAAALASAFAMRGTSARSKLASKSGSQSGSKPSRARETTAAGAVLRWEPLDLAMLAWLLVELLTTVHAVSPALGWFGEIEQHEGLLTSLGLVGFYAAARAMPGPRLTRDTLVVVLSVLAISCAIGLWQLATFSEAQWQTASRYGEFHRPFGTLGHANLLGALAAGALAAALGLAAVERRGQAWWIALAAWLGLATLLTVSRAAWLAALAGAAVALGLATRLRRSKEHDRDGITSSRAVWMAALAGSVLLVAAFALVPALRARAVELVAFGSGSGRSRVEIWKTALAMWRANPWLGNGPDTFRLLFDRYQTQDYWRIEWGAAAFHAHSIYLHVLATRGVLGILAALAVAGAAIAALVAAARADAAGRALVAPIAGLLVAIAVAGFSGAIGIAGAAIVAATLGSLPGLRLEPGTARRATAPPLPRVAIVAGGAAGIVMLVATLSQERASHAAYLSQLSETDPWRLMADARRAATIAPWSDAMVANAADVLRRQARSTPESPTIYVEAESLARRSIALAPPRLYNWSELMLILLARAGTGVAGADRAAAATAERCAGVGPYDIVPQIHFAEASLAMKRPDLALPAARRAAAVYPEEALPRALIGYAQLAQGDTAAALESFRGSLALTWRVEPTRREKVEQAVRVLGQEPIRLGHEPIRLGRPRP